MPNEKIINNSKKRIFSKLNMIFLKLFSSLKQIEYLKNNIRGKESDIQKYINYTLMPITSTSSTCG